MEENLVSKVANRVSIKTKSSKIFKRIACLGVAVGLVVGFSTCGWCNNIVDKINPNTSTSSGLTSSDDDNYTGELCSYCKGKHETSEHNQKADMSNYSEFMQMIVKDPRYAIPEDESKALGMCKSYNGMPYGFLESLGYDIDQIKKQASANLERLLDNVDDKLIETNRRKNPTTETWAFFKKSEPNNLYMLVWVANEPAQIVDNYYIKYELTDIEKRDYKWLESKVNLLKIKFFANDAISRLKKPEILSHTQQNLSDKVEGPDLGLQFIAYLTTTQDGEFVNTYNFIRSVVTEFDVKESETEPGKTITTYKGMIINDNYIYYVNSEDNITKLGCSRDNPNIFYDIYAPFRRTEEQEKAMRNLKQERIDIYTLFYKIEGKDFLPSDFDEIYKDFVANVDAPFELENS